MTYLSTTLLLFMAASMQEQATAPISDVAAPTQAAVPAVAVQSVIKRDTPIELMATKEITTADVVAGTKFKLRLNKPIIVDTTTTIPVGAVAHGEVITASDSGGLGKSGKMTARLLYLEYGSTKIPLEGELSAKGTGAGGAGAAVIFGGIAGLFHRGNNAKIKAGELINAFVSEDTPLAADPTTTPAS
jgi:hypothetical protein